jgi:type II secretory pathway component PulF
MSPDKPLPAQPHLAHLKDQADKLCRAFAANDAAARLRVRSVDRLAALAGGAELPLSSAQLVIAREYGFPGWPALKTHVASLATTRRKAQEPPMTTTDARRKDLFNFSLSLSTLQRSGVPILEGLQVAAEAVRDAGMRAAILDVRDRLREGGQSIAVEFKRHGTWFDAMFVQMVAAGEETGKLDVILDRLAAYIEQGESANPLLNFVRRMSAMIEIGMPVRQTVGIVAELEQDPGLRRVLPQVVKDVDGGRSLWEALGAHPGVFDGFFVSMVRAGDLGGVLDENLRRIADQINRSEAFDRT